ncbi:MAG: hypothetical protein Q8N87_00190 [bacterium]|nr:hypothetical protein [bacterium]
MPNIEIHGMNKKRAEDLREKIFKGFEGKSYLKETVVTIFSDIVKDAEKKDQPFLRLIDDTAETITKLDSFGLDVEYVKLAFFYQNKSKGGKK